MHPLDVVRANFGNWSPSEITALSVGMRKANEACAQTQPAAYAGDDLCDLARLCSLGQAWPQALEVAKQCIARGPEARHAHAYATEITALVQMKNVNEADKITLELLHTLPYDAEIASTVLSMKTLLEQEGNPGRTLELELAEQPLILAALQRHTPLVEAKDDALMSTGALYNSALQLAFQQVDNFDRDGASATVASLDAAVNSASLSIEDAAIIARARAAFRLLGQKLPALDVKRALLTPDAKPRIDPDYGMATVLVLFPDWCQSCRTQTKTLTEFARLNTETKIHAYALVFHDDFGVPESKPVEPDWKDLEGTSTLIVGADAAHTLGAIDFPFGVVVDQDGIVRYVGALPENAFQGNGYVERILQRVANQRMMEEQLHKAREETDKN